MSRTGDTTSRQNQTGATFCKISTPPRFWQPGAKVSRNTSAEIVDKLNKEINAGLADTKLKARLAELGSSPFVASPSEFGKHLAEQTEKWGRVVKAANLKPE